MNPNRELTPAQTLGVFLAAGWIFFFIIVVGGDLYSYGRWPTPRTMVEHAAGALVLSPLGALVIALKGGWGHDHPVVIWSVGILLLGLIALVVITSIP